MSRLNPIWIAVLYAVVSLVILFITMSVDKFFIFSYFYAWAAIFGPTLLIPGLIVFWRVRFNTWHWLIVLLGCVLVVGVSFLHILFVATASATV